MAKLETVIKEAIARGARRQVRVVVTPLRREVVRLRKKVTDLHATVTTLRRSAVGWKRLMEAAPAIPQVSEEDAKAARLSPRLIASVRRRLGLSQMALARLVGVSATAVAHWVAGDSMPTGQNRMTLVALRGGEAGGEGVARSPGQGDGIAEASDSQAPREETAQEIEAIVQ